MEFNKYLSALANRRQLITMLQGFASGLPIALIGSTLQAWYAVSHVGVLAIGALSLVGQPYVYKFFWAPLLDRYVPAFLGRRRGWILITQVFLVIAIIIMSLMHPNKMPFGLAIVALITAFLSASQDTAIDAYRTEILLAKERGMGMALYTGAYRIANLVSGGAALIIAEYIGWHFTFLLMAGLMLLQVVITLFSPKPLEEIVPKSLGKAVIEPFKEFFSRDLAIKILLFIVIYKLVDALILALGSKFLIDVGFSLTQIGVVYKGIGLVATLAGAFIGGILMLRISLFQALFSFGILQGLSNLMFMWLALVGKNISLLTATVFVENFCGGLATIAFISFLMSLCDVRYTATQFALLASLSAIGRVYIGPVAGLMAKYLGVELHPENWAMFYLLGSLVAIPGLWLLWMIKSVVNSNNQACL